MNCIIGGIRAALLLAPLLLTACGGGTGSDNAGTNSNPSQGNPATTSPGGKTSSASISSAPSTGIARTFAYAADDFSSNVSTYGINPANGELTSLGTVEVGSLPKTVSADPSGKFLYVATTWDAGVAGYRIDPATGALSLIAQTRPEGAWPPVFALEGKFLLMANNFSHDSVPFPPPQVPQSVSTFAIDPNSGALTLWSTLVIGRRIDNMVAPPGTNVAYLRAEGPNVLVACTIDPVTGSLSRVAEVVVGAAFIVAAHPSGKYAYVQMTTGTPEGLPAQLVAYRFDPAAGTLTQVGAPVPSGMLAVHPSGNFVHVASSTAISIYRVDAATGALIAAGASAPAADFGNFVFDQSGLFAYIGSSSLQAYSVDPTTGVLSPVGAPVQRGRAALSIATALTTE